MSVMDDGSRDEGKKGICGCEVCFAEWFFARVHEVFLSVMTLRRDLCTRTVFYDSRQDGSSLQAPVVCAKGNFSDTGSAIWMYLHQPHPAETKATVEVRPLLSNSEKATHAHLHTRTLSNHMPSSLPEEQLMTSASVAHKTQYTPPRSEDCSRSAAC